MVSVWFSFLDFEMSVLRFVAESESWSRSLIRSVSRVNSDGPWSISESWFLSEVWSESWVGSWCESESWSWSG